MVAGWGDRVKGDRRLDALDRRLAVDPSDFNAHYERAGLLVELGRDDEAQRGYLALLARVPTHFGALNDLGSLLYRTGYRSAARLAYAEAVKHHPADPIARINLGNALLDHGERDAAREQYEAALTLAPEHPDAHQGMANLFHELGQEDESERHRLRGLAGRGMTTLRYRGDGPPCRVLQLVSSRGGNIPTRFLLDDRFFLTSILVVEAYDPTLPLPAHDLVFNTIGDADLCATTLDLVPALLASTDAPVINSPDRIRMTGRAANAEHLAGIPGLIAPRTIVAPRAALASPDAPSLVASHGFTYPLLLRSPGFHTGRYFQRVDEAAGLAAAVSSLPGQELMVIQYLDARGADGKARKYRVMMIGGELHPLHLAISADWKVHYFTADMAMRPDHRAEEAAFFADPQAVIGARAMAALRQVCDRLALDYAGIDFGIAPSGDLLLFEANATMVVNPPEPDEIWAYRRAPVERILAATQEMLKRRANSSPLSRG